MRKQKLLSIEMLFLCWPLCCVSPILWPQYSVHITVYKIPKNFFFTNDTANSFARQTRKQDVAATRLFIFIYAYIRWRMPYSQYRGYRKRDTSAIEKHVRLLTTVFTDWLTDFPVRVLGCSVAFPTFPFVYPFQRRMLVASRQEACVVGGRLSMPLQILRCVAIWLVHIVHSEFGQ